MFAFQPDYLLFIFCVPAQSRKTYKLQHEAQIKQYVPSSSSPSNREEAARPFAVFFPPFAHSLSLALDKRHTENAKISVRPCGESLLHCAQFTVPRNPELVVRAFVIPARYLLLCTMYAFVVSARARFETPAHWLNPIKWARFKCALQELQ